MTPEQTIEISKEYDFVTIYTSTPGWKNDIRLAEMLIARRAHPDPADLADPAVNLKRLL